jgi:hypothetical protein
MITETVHDTVVLKLPDEGAQLATGQDALDLIGEAWSVSAQLVAVPVSRFDPSFFDLRTRNAGEFVQKLVNYGLRLAILGDISVHLTASGSFAAFVSESNRGAQVWFVANYEQLVERLAGCG